MKLKGKTALITGASGGLGKELAIKFSEAGCNLIITARGKDKLDAVKTESEKNGVSCQIITGDITDSKTIDALGKAASKLDILVNNAGVIYKQPIEENTDEQLERVLDVNLKAPIKLTQKLYPIFKKQKSGQIINIISTAGRKGWTGHALYAASKFGLRGFTESLREEAKEYGVKVIGVYPGGMQTDLFNNIEGADISTYMDPAEIARAVVELCKLPDNANPSEIVIMRTQK